MRIDFQHVSCSYPMSDTPAVFCLDLKIPGGTCWGLVGPGGSGKTTAGLLATGIIPHVVEATVGGHVMLDGNRAVSPSENSRGEIGLILQDPWSQLSGVRATVTDEIAFGLEGLGIGRSEMRSRVAEVLDCLRLTDVADRDPESLSGGQVQRVALASVLSLKPRLLVLDEPTTQLDPEGSAGLFDLVQEVTSSATVLLITHDHDAVLEMCSGLTILQGGEVVASGDPAHLYRAGQSWAAGAGGPAGTSLFRWLAQRPIDLPLTLQDAAQVVQERLLPPTLPSSMSEPLPLSATKTDLAFEHVSYSYSGGVHAVQDVSLQVPAGSRVALVGRNGAGKTSLARHIIGLLKPQQGRVLVGSLDTREHVPERLAKRVGYVFQHPDHQLFCRTVRGEISFGPRMLGFTSEQAEQLVQWAMRACGIERWERSHPMDLSFSRRRLVALASVLALNPSVLVLDEPTAGLDAADVIRVGEIVEYLAAEGRTVIAISHDMDFCGEFFDRAVVMDSGRVAADGSVDAVLSDAQLCRAYGLRLPHAAQLARLSGYPAGTAPTSYRRLLHWLNGSRQAEIPRIER